MLVKLPLDVKLCVTPLRDNGAVEITVGLTLSSYLLVVILILGPSVKNQTRRIRENKVSSVNQLKRINYYAIASKHGG